MTLHIPFDNSYAALPDAFYTKLDPTPVSDPRMIAYNDGLATDLGISGSEGQDAIFAGNIIPQGAEPLAQLYAGHQFGTYNPQLGDGRALLLGEVMDSNGIRHDIQLKGSGPTPYSRMGDGRAWLGPVLREYIVSEAMHALGIPTTRALAAVATGDQVYREGALPGAVLTRVAKSHIRVGTFQVFAHRGDMASLKRLTEYTIARHYPEADGPMGLLRAVVAAQAELVPAWMSLGFIHGVMNTDNCTISGETIDYGPCAFLDTYQSDKVFSSIDHMGRYSYGNQPRIIVWNMAQFATALIQQMDNKEDALNEATEIVHGMPPLLEKAWLQRFGQKIGIAKATKEDATLIEDLLSLMAQGQADFTNTFAALGSEKAKDQFVDGTSFAEWSDRWQQRLSSETDVDARLSTSNPRHIPRNHQIEAMIAAAVSGDFQPFFSLLEAVTDPYSNDAAYAAFRRPPRDSEIVAATFCGT